MKKEVLVTIGTVLMTLCTTILVLVTIREHPNEADTKQISDDDREEENVRRMVRSLTDLQENEKELIQKKAIVTETMIKEKTPWLPKNNFVSNLYLNRKKLKKGQRSDTNRQAIVYVQNPRTAGSFLQRCLANISYDLDLAMSPVMNVQNRVLWDAGNPDTSSFKNSIKIHRGYYSFGMCEKLDTKCAHILMMRDPFKRSISIYRHCKNNYQSEACLAIDANKVTMRQWILEQGSFLFNQLLFSSHLCSNSGQNSLNLSSLSDAVINKKRLPCWYKQKLALDKLLTGSDVKLLTDYIIEHLSDWFSVIGIFDDMNNSLMMFENSLNLPFTKCDMHSRHKVEIFDNKASHRLEDEDDKFNNKDDEENDEENDPSYLIDDPDVMQALDSDIRIYKKAKQIFQIQKQILLNKIRN